MISLSFNGSDEGLLADLDSISVRLEEAIRAQVDIENRELASVVVNEKLTGAILQRRSGNLADSVEVVPAENDGSRITGYVQAGGSSAIYAKFQERGTTSWYDIFPVNKKSLAFEIQGKFVFARKVHHPPIEERSFLRSTEEEMRPEMLDRLRSAIDEALSK